MSDAHAPAGWYPVAEGSPQLRYWDGTQWTEHVHDPQQAQQQPAYSVQPQVQQGLPYAAPQQQRAPEGTQPNTIMGWLNAATPVLLLIDVIPLYLWISNLFSNINLDDPNETLAREFTPTYGVVALLALASLALFIVFAALDWRALRNNGVPAPFHWAWSFFTLISFGGLVYVIGRAIVVRRRTARSGAGPMVLYIALMGAYLIATIVIVIVATVALQHQLVDQINTSGGVA